jgi:hypothetical protein
MVWGEGMDKRMNRKKKRREQTTLNLGVAWYRREQWNRLLEVADDRDNLEDTYEEWEANAKKGLRRLTRPGFEPQRIDIDIEELIRWCKLKNRPVDGAARSIFTAEKLQEQMEPTGPHFNRQSS